MVAERNWQRRSQVRGRRTSRRKRIQGTVALGIAFSLLLGVNAYIFFFRGGTSIQDLLKVNAIHGNGVDQMGPPEPSAHREPEATPKSPTDDLVLVRGTMRGQAGLSSALAAAHLSREEIDQVIAALAQQLDLTSLHSRQTYEIRLDPNTGRLKQFVYVASSALTITIERDESGSFAAVRAR